MSKSNVSILYTKPKKEVQSSDDDEDVENIWDDQLLISAYDKAVEIANAEVAKRIAMATNEGFNDKRAAEKDENKYNNASKNKSSKAKKSSKHKTSHTKWKEGMPCRVVYQADGKEYEAYINKIRNDKECIITYIGYGDSDVVPLAALKPSLGQDALIRQMKASQCEKADDGFASQSTDELVDSLKDHTFTRKKKHHRINDAAANFQMPDLFAMPQMNIPKNFPSMCMPPPPPLLPRRSDSEEQALSSMLLSWYMSGYYTGLYQGLKSKDKKK